MDIERVLFDLDGTLWDTQSFHAAAEAKLLLQYGVSVSEEEISSYYAGRPTEQVFREILHCDDALAQELSKRKWEIIFPTAPKARQLCDLRKLFTELAERGIQISIGTASPVQWARDLLRLNGLSQFFDDESLVGGDMVKRGKPDPLIWLQAARDTPLERCLVVEDGLAGIEAAVSVGIPSALLLPRRHEKAVEIASASDILHLL
ncbi:MAG: HAD-superfamily hydrolase [Parcubacteria group bacterium]|nr:HAD-superfamily hydrolase [Parcubacteria group bacterium]